MVTDNYGNLVDAATAESLSARLDAGDERMTRIEGELVTNTKSVQLLVASTAELVEFFAAMKGLFKVLNWIGNIAKPLGFVVGLAASIAALWQASRGMK